MARFSLSVLVPVFNEQHLVASSLEGLRCLESCEELSRVEVIIVDDGSTDSTPQVLNEFIEQRNSEPTGKAVKMSWTLIRHERNRGKGEAIRTALAKATGKVTVIHDADLEYSPKDLIRMMKVFEETDADAVFGSRFAGGEVRRALMYRHELGNKLLTFLCNLVSNLNLTDVWTCYKAVRTSLLRSIPLVSNDFRIEPEITIKLAKRGAKVFEVPISYFGRTYAEGKKIGLRDGFLALQAIAGFGLSDEIYKADEYGSQILARLVRAPRFNAWMADTIRDFCGDRVLEIGSGVGNLTLRLIPREMYVASDINPLYMETLKNLCTNRPYLSAAYCDLKDIGTFPRKEKLYDTVICLNVLEHVPDDGGALDNIRSMLEQGGRAIILVPQGPGNFGTLDEVLGHQRRYTKESLSQLAAEHGFQVSEMLEFNRIGSLAWFLNGKLLKRRHFGLMQVKMLNLLTPIFRMFDRVAPLPPLSLIAVLVPKAAASTNPDMTYASA